jgi:hypothetical protein
MTDKDDNSATEEGLEELDAPKKQVDANDSDEDGIVAEVTKEQDSKANDTTKEIKKEQEDTKATAKVKSKVEDDPEISSSFTQQSLSPPFISLTSRSA